MGPYGKPDNMWRYWKRKWARQTQLCPHCTHSVSIWIELCLFSLAQCKSKISNAYYYIFLIVIMHAYFMKIRKQRKYTFQLNATYFKTWDFNIYRIFLSLSIALVILPINSHKNKHKCFHTTPIHSFNK